MFFTRAVAIMSVAAEDLTRLPSFSHGPIKTKWPTVLDQRRGDEAKAADI